jgi:uncharacterized protein
MKTLILSLSIISISALLMGSNLFLSKINCTILQDEFANRLFKYQLLLTLVAVLMMFMTLKLNPSSRTLLAFGDWSKLADKEVWLGIKGASTWKKESIQLLCFISVLTASFMYMGVKQSSALSNFSWSFIPLVLLFSLTNSFSEEIIYRFGILGNINATNSKTAVLILSAVLFGLPHYFGNPSGIIGVLMAGILGYILSKASYETQGLGIACVIHFVQDAIIFTSLFMIKGVEI